MRILTLGPYRLEPLIDPPGRQVSSIYWFATQLSMAVRHMKLRRGGKAGAFPDRFSLHEFWTPGLVIGWASDSRARGEDAAFSLT